MALYETHLPVRDLAASTAFYRDVVGLVLAYEQTARGVGFLWVNDARTGMLGLWAPGSAWGWKPGEAHRCHFALSVALPELHAHLLRLRARGIAVLDFHGQPTAEPSVIGWMPSTQIYFKDPDGHLVEYIAILEGATVPDFIGSWSEWQRRTC